MAEHTPMIKAFEWYIGRVINTVSSDRTHTTLLTTIAVSSLWCETVAAFGKPDNIKCALFNIYPAGHKIKYNVCIVKLNVLK